MTGPVKSVKAGVSLKAVFTPLKIGFNGNITFAFQAAQKLSAHNTNKYFRVFCKFFGDFSYNWEEIVLLKRVVNFVEIRNI